LLDLGIKAGTTQNSSLDRNGFPFEVPPYLSSIPIIFSLIRIKKYIRKVYKTFRFPDTFDAPLVPSVEGRDGGYGANGLPKNPAGHEESEL
jgi:hypothetical protein